METKQRSIRALCLLNFFVSDVQTGMGPYVTLFLRAGMGWGADPIGKAVGAGYLALVLAQVPMGALIDRTRRKRELIVVGSVLVMLASLGTVLLTHRAVVVAGQSLIGVAGAILPPCIAAIALGLVGRARMDRQQGRNQAYNAAGNVAAAVVTSLVGFFFGLHWMFYVLLVFCGGAILCALRIRPGDIDNALARGDDRDAGQKLTPAEEHAESLWHVLLDRRILIFVVSALLLNLSNASMAPLVTEQLAGVRHSHFAALYTGCSAVAVQGVYLLVAARAGGLAGTWGRKPLYLAAFGAVALRGVLLTLGHGPAYWIGVQTVEGVVAGISSVVSVLIIADLTRGTGRFNVTQGAFAASQGLGASLSNFLGGPLAQHFSANTAFLTLAAIAVGGLFFFWRFMPETRLSRRLSRG